MINVLQELEAAATHGADGLTAAARDAMCRALYALRRADGGFAGRDGRSDPYYTLFAWLSLRALRAATGAERVCDYMRASHKSPNRTDAACVRLLLSLEDPPPRKRASLFSRRLDLYGTFFDLLSAGSLSFWTARLLAWRQRGLFRPCAINRLPTPHLAIGLILRHLAGQRAPEIQKALDARRCSGGGYAAAEHAPADLLATAVTRFAKRIAVASPAETDDARLLDLAFTEACWTDDGLFGDSPSAQPSDAEYTFYGLLSLGTLRVEQEPHSCG